MEVTELAKLLGNYGMGVVCLAVLIALHIYNVRITLPKLADDGRQQVTDLVAVFKFELAEERKQCHDDHEKLLLAVSHNQEAIAETRQTLSVLLDRHGRGLGRNEHP